MKFFSRIYKIVIYGIGFITILLILCFVGVVLAINWLLTKCHLKRPEPEILHHYFTIRDIQTDKEMFRHEDRNIVEAEEARRIHKYGKAKYDQNFCISEVKKCGIVPTNIVQKLTTGILKKIMP